jgi:hypothetical protein
VNIYDFAAKARLDSVPKPSKGKEEAPDSDASDEPVSAEGTNGKESSSPSEQKQHSKGAHEAGKQAFKASADTPIKDHVEAHREAAKRHDEAAKMHHDAGHATAAEAHEMCAKDHKDCADKMEKQFGKSHLWGE